MMYHEKNMILLQAKNKPNKKCSTATSHWNDFKTDTSSWEETRHLLNLPDQAQTTPRPGHPSD